MRTARASNHLCHAYLEKQSRSPGFGCVCSLQPGGRIVCTFSLAGPVPWDLTDRPDAPAQGFGAHCIQGPNVDLSAFESPDAAFLLDNIVAGDADKAMLRCIVFLVFS